MIKGLLLFLVAYCHIHLSIGKEVVEPELNPEKGFVENKGQVIDQFGETNGKVKFLLSTPNMNFQLRKNGFSYDLYEMTDIEFVKDELDEDEHYEQREYGFHRIDVDFKGASQEVELKGRKQAEDYLRYYTGNSPDEGTWKVFHYEKVVYKGIYEGIDVVFKVLNGDECEDNVSCIKYDFIVHPEGDWRDIEMKIEGADGVKLNDDGSLKLLSNRGNVTETIPYSYIDRDIEKEIEANYKLSKNIVKFELDENLPEDEKIVIDPSIEWSTYYGGSGFLDQLMAIDRDEYDNIYVGGETNSTTNIATAGAHQTTLQGSVDVLFVKFDEDGNLQWATYMGASGGWSHIRGIYVRGGLINIAGRTSTSNGLASTGAHQTSANGTQDGFLASFNYDGTRNWSTYYGGSSFEDLRGAVIDSNGNFYATGHGLSTNNIATLGSHQYTAPSHSAINTYLIKFDSSGNRLWGTYIGGSGGDRGIEIDVDEADNVYVVGGTFSSSGIATPGTLLNNNPGSEAGFVTKFSPSGNKIWGTYLGGTSEERIRDVAIADSAYFYVSGRTESNSGIATTGAHQETQQGGTDYDGFLVKFDSTGNREWGTYYGGGNEDDADGVAVAENGLVCITGRTLSNTNIATSGALQSNLQGGQSAYFAVFDENGKNIAGSYLGGSSSNEIGRDVIDLNEYFVLTGRTASSDFPVLNAHQSTNLSSSQSGYITHFLISPPSLKINYDSDSSFCSGDSVLLAEDVGGSGNFSDYQWYRNGDSISGATDSFYYAKDSGYFHLTAVDDTNKFYSSDSLYVEYFDNPQFSSFPEDTAICKNDTLQINTSVTGGSPPYYYKWSPSAGLSDTTIAEPEAFPDSTTEYSLDVTDINGCSVKDSFNLAMSDPPQVSASSEEDTMCMNGSIQLYGSGAENYLWQHNPTSAFSDSSAQNPVFTSYNDYNFILNYLISVKGIDSAGCYTTDTLQIPAVPSDEIPPPSQVCLETTENNENELSWQMISDTSSLEFINVYRRQGHSGSFDSLGAIPDTSTQWTDTTQNAGDTYHQYFITTYSDCNIESEPSDTVNNMLFSVNQFQSDSAEFNWEPLYLNPNVYEVEVDSGNGFEILDTSSTTDFMTGSDHCSWSGDFRVTNNGQCNISSSEYITFQDTTPPVPFQLDYATINQQGNTEIFAERESPDDMTAVKIYRKVGNESDFSLFDSVNIGQDLQFQYEDASVDWPDTTYCYKIAPVDSCGNEGAKSYQHCPVPLTGQEGNLQNQLNWENYVGWPFDSVEVQRFDDGEWNTIFYEVTGDTSFVDTNVACNTPETYRLKSLDSAGSESSFSNEVILTPFDTTAPATPVMRYASHPDDSTMELEWELSDPNVNQYEIQLQTNGGNWVVDDTVDQANYHLIENLSARGNYYCARVVAIDSCGPNRSGPSESHCPPDLDGQAENLANDLFWQDYQGFAQQDDYQVQRWDGNQWVTIDEVQPGAESYNDDSVFCNIEETYRLRANDQQSNYSSYSNTVSLTPFDTVPPEPPEVHYATVQENGTVNLSWSLSTSNDVDTYVIHRKEKNGSFSPLDTIGNETEYSDTSIDFASQIYCYAVQAIDSCANNVSALSTTHCPVQLNTHVDGCKQEIELSWSTYQGWDDVEQYVIYREEESGYEPYDSVSGSLQSFADDAVSFPDEYCYYIEAREQNGEHTSQSNIQCGELFEPVSPVVKSASKLTTSSDTGEVKVSWQVAEDTSALEKYVLYHKGPADGAFSAQDTFATDDTEVTYGGLNTREDDFSYFITSVDTCGNESFPSDTHKTMTIDVLIGQLQHDVQWTPYKGFDDFDYLVEMYQGGSFSVIDTTKDTSYSQYPAPCNVPQFYRITAISSEGNISYSDTSGRIAIDSVPPDPSTMIDLSVENGNEVHLSFEGSDSLDIWRFFVERDPSAVWPDSVASFLFDEPSDTFFTIDDQYDFLSQGCYFVRAVDSCLNDALTQEFCHIKTEGEAQNLQNQVSWHQFEGYSIESYIVQRENNGAWESLDTLSSNDTSYTDQPLPCNVPEIYRIQGLEDGGDRTTFSDTIMLTPFDTTAPSPPEIKYTSHPNDTSLELEWELSDPKVKQYEIQLQTNGGNWVVEDTVHETNQHLIDGLWAKNNRYCMRVVAIDSCAANRSQPSAVHCPPDLDGQEANLANELLWQEYEGFLQKKDYEIQRWDENQWVAIDSVAPGEEYFKDEPLPCNVAETYRVKATSEGDEYVSFSNTVSLTPFDTTDPAVPELEKVSVEDEESISMEWQLSDPKVKMYELHMKPAGGNWSVMDTTGQQTEYTFNGLSPADTVYCFRAVAIDSCAANRSEPAVEHCAVKLDGTEGNLANLLDWTEYEGFDSLSYRAQEEIAGNWEDVDTLSESTTNYDHEPIPCDVSRKYRVAVNDGSNESYSNAIILTPFDTIAPPVPDIKAASVTDENEITLNWDKGIGSDAKYFEVWRQDTQQTVTLLDTVVYGEQYIDNISTEEPYSYTVIAIDSCEATNRSAAADTHRVMNLQTATGACSPLIELDWSSYKGFSDWDYHIFRKEEGGTFSEIEAVPSDETHFTDSSVTEGTTYCYRVEAFNNQNGEFSYSYVRCEEPYVFPEPEEASVINVTVDDEIGTDAETEIIWNRADLQDPYADGYRLYHIEDDQSGEFTMIHETYNLDDTLFTHENVDASSERNFYFVEIFNICDVAGDPSAIHSPVLLEIENLNLEASLTWSEYEGRNVGEYEVYRSKEGGDWRSVATVTEPEYSDDTLSCFMEYDYRIKAELDNGREIWSNIEGIEAFDDIEPEQSDLFRVTVVETGETDGRVLLEFEGAGDHNLLGYEIYRQRNQEGMQLIDTLTDTESTIPEYIDENINTQEHTFQYYVSSVDSCENRAEPSGEHRTMHLEAEAESGQNVIDWTSYEGWPQVEEYILERSGAAMNWQELTTVDGQNQYVDSEVRCDSVYNYRIVARSDEGTYESYSNFDQVTAYFDEPQAAPELSYVSVAETGENDGTIEVFWDHFSDVYYYNLYRSDDEGESWTPVAEELHETEMQDSLLNTSGQQYQYSIEGVDSCYNVTERSEIHAGILLNAESGEESVQLRWEAYQGWEVQEYLIERDGEIVATIAGSETEYLDEELLCTETYHFRVGAVSAEGYTSWSNEDSASPEDTTPPDAPFLEAAGISDPNEGTIIKWEATEAFDVSHYEVYRQAIGQANTEHIHTTDDEHTTEINDVLHDEPQEPVCYQVKAIDICGNESELSNRGCVMVLEGNNDSLANQIEWTAYREWSRGVHQYNIYKSEDDGPWNQIGMIPGDSNAFIDEELSDHIRDYCYQIEAISPDGHESLSTVTCLQQNAIVHIPNAFSPGVTPGINDEFEPGGMYIESYSMEIYNRWGQKIFESEDSEYWDGKDSEGNYVDAGVYLYQIRILDYNGEITYHEGTITVIN